MATFGKELSCLTGINTGRYVSNIRVVGEACFRRLNTPRGMLRGGEDEANYGLDLTELIGGTDAVDLAASLPGQIENELLKDERIESVTADVVVDRSGSATSFTITVACITSEGPFTLQVGANEVTVALLGLDV